MGLIGNNFRLNTGVRVSWGEVMARTAGNANRYQSFCNTRSQDMATTVQAGNAIPAGSYPSASYYPPQVAGQMAMRTWGPGSMIADLFPSKSMEINLTGSGTLTAEGALVIAMLVAMTGAGDLDATIEGRLDAAIAMTGTGDLTGSMEGFANMLVSLTGSGDLESTIAAYGNMSIDIVVTGTGLTTANVGQAVWSAIAAANDESGTMGEKLNAAGSAGDPWTTALPGAYAAGTAGDIIGDIATQILNAQDGVESNVDLQQAMRAILAALTGVASGGDTTQITFRDPDNTVDRVVMNVDEDGNRSSVTLNL